jgi:hypothetical protein
VELTAGVVRATYIQERSLIDGKSYIPSVKWDGNGHGRSADSIWQKIAQKLLLYGVEPGNFVRHYFERIAVVGGNRIAYYPTDLLNESLIKAYRDDWRPIAIADLRDSFNFQTNIARIAFLTYQGLRKVDAIEATKAVLWDLDVELTPLFRFCWAVSMKRKSFRKIRDNYLLLAAIQYSSDSECYDEVWGDRIPQSFKTYVIKTLGLACKGRKL